MIKRLKMNKKTVSIVMIALLCVFGIIFWSLHMSDIKLKKSTGNITIKYIDKYKDLRMLVSLAELEQSDVWNDNNLIIVSGVIESIQNIKINMDGEVDYDAIVKITPHHFIKGKTEQDGEITVLARCLVGSKEIWQEDSFINASINVGNNVIAILRKCDDEDTFEMNNCKLYLNELADYRFGDAMRYAFIENNKGKIVYFKHLYNDLDNPKSLSDVENYINEKLK